MNKKYLVIFSIIALINLIGFLIFDSLTPKAFLKIELAPEQVYLKIDNENNIYISNGSTIRVKPGDHKISFSRDEFKSNSLNISIKKDETKTIVMALKPLTANARKLLNNSKSNKVIEKFTGINLYNQDKKTLSSYPILNILPISNKYYSVVGCESKLYPNDSEKIAICVTMDDQGYKTILINELTARGYSLDNYEVIWN